MENNDYIGVIKRRLWIIILLPLIAGMTAYFYSHYFVKPSFEANTTLYINTAQKQSDALNTDDMVARQYLVKDYRELIKSRTVLLAVTDNLAAADLTYGELVKNVSVSSKSDTRLIEISVNDSNPERAMIVANLVAEQFIASMSRLLKTDNIRVIDPAILPEKPAGHVNTMNTAAAALAGLILAMFLAFLVDYLDNTIKTEKDVEHRLNLNVLGIIPVID